MNLEQENELAKLLQKKFPLDKEPFKVLAEQINSTEEDVLLKIQEWKNTKRLREISAVMEGELLGYESALVCAEVSSEKIEDTASVISEHPLVTHNYQRNHKYNLWFTIASERKNGVEEDIKILSSLTGISNIHPLKKIKVYKIGVVVDLKNKTNVSEKTIHSINKKQIEITEKNKRLIQIIQKDLPAVKNPFKVLADENNAQEEEIINFLNENMGGAVRKYIGTFMHRKMGVTFNGMAVWNVKPENLDKAGEKLAQFPDVSHCYSRTPISDFPYSLYSMIHGSSSDYLTETAEKMSRDINCDDYLILTSTREFKKTRLRYFIEEYNEWLNKYKGAIKL
ncbi:MAG: hypothetical protein OEZ22_05775 [Spirochaetia bacterium]|nr:hypothetical protein [Spirochaetia bacterium]